MLWQVIIFFTDHKTSLKRETELVESQVKELKGIKLVSVGIGPHIDIRELQKITSHGRDVIHVGECENPDTVTRRIWHGI